jgi:hypothetical protein
LLWRRIGLTILGRPGSTNVRDGEADRGRNAYRDDVPRERSTAGAFARLEWGHSPEAVVRDLVQSGFSAREAAEVVRDFHAEHTASQRRWHKAAVFGSAALAVCGVGLTVLNILVDARIGDEAHDVGQLAFVLGYQLNRYTWGVGLIAIILGVVGITYFAGGWFAVVRARRTMRVSN